MTEYEFNGFITVKPGDEMNDVRSPSFESKPDPCFRSRPQQACEGATGCPKNEPQGEMAA
jgi:hypothetical protein